MWSATSSHRKPAAVSTNEIHETLSVSTATGTE
jgi:hypothetical protein